MAARTPGVRSTPASRLQDFTRLFFPRGIFTVSLDGLSERGTTRGLALWALELHFDFAIFLKKYIIPFSTLCLFGQENHMIIVTSSFSKSSVFKTFAVQTKTQSRRFQFPDPFSRPISVNIRSNLSVFNFLQRIGAEPGWEERRVQELD